MPERIHAPELSGATAWLNTERPLSIRELRGQVVVLDFWTYCCVNCMHVLPILRDLEERHRDQPLVVIGVHSAKFDAEKDSAHILAAMRRYGVSHPVAVDSEMRIWSQYAVRSWPTLVVIRPDGTLAAVAPGEPDPAVLEAFVAEQLKQTADPPLHFRTGVIKSERALSFPGKLAQGGGKLFIADSGHHRVLITDLKGHVLDAIGSGLRGMREGSFDSCAMDDPQGLAFQNGMLYIADARAHVVWRAELPDGQVRPFAGTGELGRAPLAGRTPALETALRSPWDVAPRGPELYVALAGSHQVALVQDGFVEPIAGNGREAQIDGPGAEAALAQPSGLSLQGDVLYVADSESSGVRAIDLRSRKIYSLAGGPGLFDFGDQTGAIRPGMLQHPLAVAATASEGLLVADTYNDKVKRFSPDGLRLEPFYDGDLEQPAGLCVLPDGDVLIADTNHHRIVSVRSGEIRIDGAPEPVHGAVAPAQGSGVRPQASGWFTALLSPIEVAAAENITIVIKLEPPLQFEIADGAPWTAAVEVTRRSDLVSVTPEFARAAQPAEIVLQARCAAPVESELIVNVRAVACDARDHAACWPVANAFRVPLRVVEGGPAEARLALPLEVAT